MTKLLNIETHPLAQVFSVGQMKAMLEEDLIYLMEQLEELDDRKTNFVLLALKSIFEERTPTIGDIDFLIESFTDKKEAVSPSSGDLLENLVKRGRGRPDKDTLTEARDKVHELTYINVDLSKALRRAGRTLRGMQEQIKDLLDELENIG